MFLSDFDYDLPRELVARYPTARRRDSRLLVVGDTVADHRFEELATFLRSGDLLVFNDTRVIPARLRGRKTTGGKVEILMERILSETEALVQLRASKTPRAGTVITLAADCDATVVDRERDLFHLQFSQPVRSYVDEHGETPLPPYLERDAEVADAERYQTVFARDAGAVAAPTAGLHFDEAMMAETLEIGTKHAYVTLHVGAGTFQPLRDDTVEANSLHAERVTVSGDVCDLVDATRRHGGRVIAVGTTSVRALETASAGGVLQPLDGESDLFIYPGFQFRSVDVILTNFHLPRSSLMMLVAAFGGRDRMLDAYRHAVASRYRFFSYGDAMLIFPE